MKTPEKPARKRWVAIVVTAFIACVWLNQSVDLHTWEVVQARVFGEPRTASMFETIRYPFIFAYRRAQDEEIYCATARAVLGRSYDPKTLALRGKVPESFTIGPPRNDGRVRVPYANVPLEYPPIAVPFIVLPEIVAGVDSSVDMFGWVFGVFMAACLLGAFWASIETAPFHAEERRRRWWLCAALLLAHGGMAIQRLDAIVALFLALALRAAMRKQFLREGLWLGLTAASKLVPVLLIPMYLASEFGSADRVTRMKRIVAGAALGIAIGLGPMLFASPHAFADLLAYHSARGLHCEAFFATIYSIICLVSGNAHSSTFSYGSSNFDGATATALARATMPFTLILIGGVFYFVLKKSRAIYMHAENATGTNDAAKATSASSDANATSDEEDARRSLLYWGTLAGLIAMWLGGKVFSPQYLTWALPVVVALRGKWAVRAMTCFFVALVLTQTYNRGYNQAIQNQEAIGVITITARQVLLVVIGVFAIRSVRGGEGMRS